MKPGKVIFLLVLCAAGFAFYRWNALGREAAALKQTVERQILSGASGYEGARDLAARVRDLAASRGISLSEGQVQVRNVGPEKMASHEAIFVADSLSGVESYLLIEMRYELASTPITRRFHQKLYKPIHGGSSQYRGVAPPPAARAVDVPHSSRDAGSYRRDVKRAVGGYE